eukprot:TRINITY_DN5709_c1_g1_i3.p1 TRINITY_DN5709_c1_g1~~TRINITY_DN5709_c1_g1_i3.p1  ORF type:complete len:389 (+),score=29.63 TRINITY_DN5709_c1_g1_i3:271-1437(+)
MSGGDLWGKLKRLDAYPKINEDFFTRTLSGGVITLVASTIMILLFISEFRMFLTVQKSHQLNVDTTRGERISITIDVTFPRMPCSWVSLDIMDISGEVQLDVDHDVYKRRLDSKGKAIDEGTKHDVNPELDPQKAHKPLNLSDENYCGSCYGAEKVPDQCCNTCKEVKNAYKVRGWAIHDIDLIEQCRHEEHKTNIKEQKGEGCHIWGELEANKVAGNFHFAPGRSYQEGGYHVHDLVPFDDLYFDLSHTINKMSFGDAYPGMRNPLEGVYITHDIKNVGQYQYYLKVVPTTYEDISSRTIYTNQYSATEHFKLAEYISQKSMPGVFFYYDLSPIKVKYREYRSSFLHFLTNVCAIVGGVFTVSGIIDAFVYHGHRVIQKKIELGKFS